jgi:hypothetical protein
MYMFQIYNFIITAILIIFPFHIISREKDHLFLRILFVYHIIFFILNFYYKGYFASDANGYFFWAQDSNYNKGILSGTTAIVYLIKFAQNFLKFDEINIHLMFSLFGYVGILIAFKVINKKNNHFINKIIFLFPSFHFFTSSVGKDAIVIFIIGFLILFFDKKKIILYLIFIGLFFLVRFHIAIMFGSLIILLLFSKYHNKFFNFLKNNLIAKIIVISKIFILIYFIFVFKSDLLYLINKVYEIFLVRQSFFYLGTSGYPVEYLNILEMIFYYLFAPLGIVIDKSIFYTLIAIENFILLTYFLICLIFCKYKNFKILNIYIFLILFIFSYLITVSFINTNLGISTRQKWMILPFVFYVFSIYCNFTKLRFRIKQIL